VSRITSLSEWLLRQAVVWGGLGYLAFYALAVRGAAPDSWLAQYFDGHYIKYATGLLFFIGLAALVIRGMGLALQFSVVDRVALRSPLPDGDTIEETGTLLAELETLPSNLRDSYLVRRLREALLYVRRKGSADVLEAQLRHLEEVDVSRMSQGYGAVRIIVSIIPILGFLGTVLGITLAIARLDADSMEQALPAVINGLSVAFDTTALSLALSMVLLLTKYLVERMELRLLSRVDALAGELLLGRFRQYGTQNDPHVAAVKRMCEQMLSAVQQAAGHQSRVMTESLTAVDQRVAESLVATDRRVSEALNSTQRTVNSSVDEACRRMYAALETAHTRWEEMTGKTGSLLEKSLTEGVTAGLQRHAASLNEGVARHHDDLKQMLVRHAEILSESCDRHAEKLADSLEHHTAIITESETQLADENRRHLSDVEAALGEAMLVAATRQEKLIQSSEDLLKEMQIALVEGAGATVAQQEQLVKQGEVLLKVVDATGHVRQLEDALNSNLQALTTSRNFEDMLASLSATLHLLSSRLGQSLHFATREVDLSRPDSKNQAA
jgi:biopolymer transport protein ExbB/TolQ